MNFILKKLRKKLWEQNQRWKMKIGIETPGNGKKLPVVWVKGLGGHTHQCSGAIPGSATRDNS